MAGVVDKINLIAKLLDALPDHQPGFNNDKLSEWLEQNGNPVVLRQLQRDLVDLELLEWTARAKDLNGKKGDYWICAYQGTRILNKNDMTRERAFALQLIQHKLQHLMPEQILKALKEEFRLSSDKLRQHGGNEREMLGKIGEAPPFLRTPSLNDGVFAAVTEALLEGKWLDVDYTNKKKESGLRPVMPLGLASKDGLFYLIGRYKTDPADGAGRQFRMDRILSAKMSDEPFAYPADFRLVDYLDKGFFDYPNGEKIQLVARIRNGVVSHLDGQQFPEGQNIARIDNEWSRLTATVQDSMRLRWWILAFGCQFVVEEPASLRDLMKEHVEELAHEYGVNQN